MRVLSCVFLFILSEAKASDARDDYDDEAPSPLQEKVDVYPVMQEPVPFGHLTLEGFGDPFSKTKPPIDGLELSMRTPRNREEAREMLKYDLNQISLINYNLVKGFLGPRDKFIRERMIDPPPETNTTQLKWHDLTMIQTRNAMRQSNPYLPRIRDTPNPVRPKPPASSGAKRPFFAKDSFELSHQKSETVLNWTTCDQFGVGAIFSAKDIVKFKWTPFFIWSLKGSAYAIEHSFEYPTKKVVGEYQSKYGKFLNKTIDWTSPKLLMKGMSEMLLIAADKKGLFDAIVQHDIPESAKDHPVTLPSLSLRIKIEDPYLVMTYCEDYYAVLMAISGKGPTRYNEMRNEASTIKFVGIGNPVWRDYEAEKKKIKLTQEAKEQKELNKFIDVNEPIPPVGQWD